MNMITASFKKMQDIYIARISRVVDEMMIKEEVFRERLYRTEIITYLTKLMKSNFSPDEFLSIDEEDFKRCVGQLMVKQLLD